MSFYPALPNPPDTFALTPYDPANIRVLTGKVARAIFGPTYSSVNPASSLLTRDQLKDLTADTIAKLIFFSNGLLGYQLVVTDIDSTGMPQEYQIQMGGSPRPLPIQDETLIVTQAALDWFFFEFKDKKISEKINDEGQNWEYALSPALLTAQYKQLIADRDRALAVVQTRLEYFTDYVSFLGERDALTSALVEWWVRPGFTYPSGQEVFPGVAAFGG